MTPDSRGKNTTICITTLNRPKFLERTLRYYRDTGFGGVLAIADGSLDAFYQQTLEALSKDLRIDYQHLPGKSQAQSMTILAEGVTSKYALYIGDDDFVISEGIEACEIALENNPDFVSAHGNAAAIYFNGTHGIPFFMAPYHLPHHVNESAIIRLMDFFHEYATGIFCLHRSDTWKEIFRQSYRMKDKIIAGEVAPCAISAVMGKSIELNIPYLFRQIHSTRYELAQSSDWILGKSFAQSSKLMLNQLEKNALRIDIESGECDQPHLYEARVWNAYMGYLNGQNKTPLHSRSFYQRNKKRMPNIQELFSAKNQNSAIFSPILDSILGENSSKPALLINWGNPYVLDEAITPVLSDLAKKFRIVLLLVDYNLTDEMRERTLAWKDDGLIMDVLVAPTHGGTLELHQFMNSLMPAFRHLNFDVFLTISAMQPYERYLLDWILPKKCLRIVFWPHPTNLFIYPELTKAVLNDGRRSSIDTAIKKLCKQTQPPILKELLYPSLTSIRLGLFIGLNLVYSILRPKKDVDIQVHSNHSEQKETVEEIIQPQTPKIVTIRTTNKFDHSWIYSWSEQKFPTAFKLALTAWSSIKKYPYIRSTIINILDDINSCKRWLSNEHRFYIKALLYFKSLKLFISSNNEGIDFSLFTTGKKILYLPLAGLNLSRLVIRYRHTCDRYLFPLIFYDKTMPFGRLDSITQIGTDQFDACLFFNESDTAGFKHLYENPNFYTIRYVPPPQEKIIDPVNAILMPFSAHSEGDITPELISIYQRDMAIALKESGADEIHIRPHPGRDTQWLGGLVSQIKQGGVPCRLVTAEKQISHEAARYIGVFGVASGALRDAHLACPDIFVAGSVALSNTHYDLPKECIGFPENIGWIETDGSYDPSIFKPKKGAYDQYPNLVEQIETFVAGKWNEKPQRLKSI